MEYKKEYEKWCTNPLFDEKTRAELINIKENERKIDFIKI